MFWILIKHFYSLVMNGLLEVPNEKLCVSGGEERGEGRLVFIQFYPNFYSNFYSNKSRTENFLEKSVYWKMHHENKILDKPYLIWIKVGAPRSFEGIWNWGQFENNLCDKESIDFYEKCSVTLFGLWTLRIK